MPARIGNRRLFVGDLHGCLAELNDLLDKFGFRAGQDELFSVGDVVGKGPSVPGTLALLRELKAGVVRGNHDEYLMKAVRTAEADRDARDREYLAMLGPQAEEMITYVSTWPVYRELADIILVHGGLEPGQKNLAKMSERILMQIRTWDGFGKDLKRNGDPPWYDCVQVDKVVVFGHWAQNGLVDKPRFKGLDTGCVYGGMLTGWCPEENRFLQVPAHRTYSSIHYH